jgi:hypothetical protein
MNKNKFKELEAIKEFLLENYIKLFSNNKSGNDGRLESASFEDIITNFLLENKEVFDFNISVPNIREWYDLKIICKNEEIKYVNIKATNMKSSDNSANFRSLLYTYTNTEEYFFNDTNNNRKKDYLKLIDCVLNNNYSNNRDYYFLVFDKSKNNIIINSLRYLNEITFNNSNLPFQINWSKNTEFSKDEKTLKFYLDGINTKMNENSFDLLYIKNYDIITKLL